jgi:hypothetical protein
MKLIYKAKSGHKYFEDDQKRLHIADDSGNTPLETEDGDLIVDPTRQITVTIDSPFDAFTIPLITPKGKHCSSIGSVHEVLFLRKHGLTLDQETKDLVEHYLDDLSLDF